MKSIIANASVIIALSFTACKSNKNLVVPIEPDYEHVMLDTLTVTPEDGISYTTNIDEFAENPYQAAATRYFDLLHTKLDIKFDWANRHVLGIADLDLTPLAYAQDSLVLDAKTMEIKSISLRDNGTKLNYRNDGKQIFIRLDKSYKKNDLVKLSINYIGKPEEGPMYGSAAITSDKGLFFINHDNKEANKPQQIWTQGETENNSKWFPTFDKPNERCTQEITITVEDRFATLSNGKLISSKKNADGTRSDYYKQDKPHAPYLFMMAVGEYAVIEDKWENIPLQYMVEKPYAPYAKQIFNHTPEMLGFFSNLFQYKYPWDKYSQVITRDYVSGAMENTSAVIFGEFVQKTDRELIDDNNDKIVAHEMSHHWFGDLVTTESWSNLTLNEGFANYSEYLWTEYKYGKMMADEHRYNELNGYLSMAYTTGLHPLIHYRYANKEDMFDVHSYNKGGLVLHYLRNYLGDEIFFNSLATYLKKNEYTSVEVDELRMAFEDVSGEDLHWFFDQWYLKKGHPEINVNYEYNAENKILTINTKQDSNYIFKLPVEVAIIDKAGKTSYKKIWINNLEESIKLPGINEQPITVVFDGKSMIPGIINETKTSEEWLETYKYSKNYVDKISAFNYVTNEDPAKKQLIDLAIKDEFYAFRQMAIINAELLGISQNYKDIIASMATNDKHSLVREAAVRSLILLEGIDKKSILKSVFEKEKAYNVIGEAITQLGEIDQNEALQYCTLFEKENVAALDNKIAAIYAKSPDARYNDWFINKMKNNNPYALFELCAYYNVYLLQQPAESKKNAISLFANIGKNQTLSKYDRYIGTASLFSLKNLLISQKSEAGINNDDLIKLIANELKAIKVVEKDEELIERYSEF